jgi:predicted nucleic acid-binding protein
MSVPRSRHVRRVLVDSAAYYALTDQESLQHQRAVAVIAQLAAEHCHLFTTNFIVAETHSLLLNRLGRDLAALVLQRIDQSTTTIVRISATDERRARDIISGHRDKDYTLTDATSFAVMERLRIGDAFTFDRHFAQYGYALLGPEGA